MEMHALQAFISGQIGLEQISVKELVDLAKQQDSLQPTERHLLEKALDLILIYYLKQAQAYL